MAVAPREARSPDDPASGLDPATLDDGRLFQRAITML